MRICLVTPYDLSHDGGVNRHVVALAEALGNLGHDANVLGPASGDTPPECDALPGVVAVSANGSMARVGLLVSKRAVRRYLHDGDFDIVHVHEPAIPGIAHHAVTASAARLVATFHTYSERESRTIGAIRHAFAHSLERIQSGIAVSHAAAEFARRIYQGPLRVIPNGIAVSDFGSGEPVSSRLHHLDGDSDAGGKPLRVLFVGRFDEPRKGLRHLLMAAALIRSRGRAVKVHVAGQGNPERFSELARRTDVRFLGRLDDLALGEAYRGCDVFCAPATHGESFGLVLIEAMACGRPVVASDIRGYREASAGAAILVPPADPGALATAILHAADDHALRHRLVSQGCRRARQLAWDHLAVDISRLYEATLAGDIARQRVIEVPA